MSKFHLFQDKAGRIIAIEDEPGAIDAAPYDRIERRHSSRPVEEDLVDEAMNARGGQVIYADGAVVSVDVL